MSYNDMVIAAVRLAVLQILEQDTDYSHNEHILQALLGKLGHGLSSDRVRTELRWLEEQGLIRIEDISGTLVARLTRRGADVSQGTARVDGVARPRPGL
jgi:Fe2+ or Zn2+ uptake regulation protein